jgi:4-hydroxy-tetrahydrodipicolinate synthase
LTSEEKNRVLQTVAETTNGRVPLVVGVGGNNTRAVCDALQSGMPEGYSGVLSVSPYYNKPTQEGIYQHYKAVCGSTDAPVILYNVPGRTGSNVLAETTLRVAHDCPNAVAMKEASGNLEQAMALVQGAPDGFEVLSGDDNLTLPLIASGATGVISVSGQAYPGLFSQMVRDARSGHLDRARTAHYALFRFTQLLFAEGNPGGIKAALAQLEVMENQLRLPLVPVSSSLQGELRKAMAELA